MVALRPEYTDYVYKLLDKNSLNIYAPHGRGQLRLLADLQDLAHAQGDQVLVCNMKSYAENYQGFIEQLAIQIEHIDPNINAQELHSLADVFNDRINPSKTLLFLNNFDAILNTPQIDQRYDLDFFNHLNALKNQGHRLICVTEAPHNNALVYINGEEHGNSWLDLKKLELQPLSYDEITEELLRQKYKPYHHGFSLLIDTIKAHPQSYDFLDFIYPRLKFPDEVDNKLLKHRLATLQTEFKNSEKTSAMKTLHYGVLNLQKIEIILRKVPKVMIELLAKILKKFK